MAQIHESQWVPTAPVTFHFSWLKLMQAQIKDYLSSIPEQAIWKIWLQRHRVSLGCWSRCVKSILFRFYCLPFATKSQLLSRSALSVRFLCFWYDCLAKCCRHGFCLSVHSVFPVCTRHCSSVAADVVRKCARGLLSHRDIYSLLYSVLIF